MADPQDNNSTVILGSAPRAAASGSQNALPIGTQLGEFEIIDLIGEGGFGIVYLAQDHSLHRKVAIKEYMPSALAARSQDAQVSVRSEKQRETFGIGLRSFVNEARILAQYDHPALIKVFRFWEANGTAYMAMPYLSGKNLKDVLKDRDTAPDEAWIRKILSPVMDALELIHRDSCYHRDIAPDNIMLLDGERPVLLDFGAARRVISDMTQALTVILKPGYAPIEQYAEMPGMKQGPWTDIYALGAVVYFMILGQKPPPSVGRMMQDSYEPLALSPAAGRYSDRFLQGIDLCLNVKSEERPQTIAEMREAIGFGSQTGFAPAPKKAARPAPRPATPSSFKPATSETPTRGSKLPLLLAGGLITVAAFAGAWYYKNHMQAAPASETAVLDAPAIAQAVASSAASVTPSAPAQPKFSSLGDAFAGAASAGDSTLGLSLDAPASLTIGSPLALSLQAREAGFVYLYLYDSADDRVLRLFPNADDADNALAAGAKFELPRSRIANPWVHAATTPLGDWKLLAVLSDKPRDLDQSLFKRAGGPVARKELESALADSGLFSLIGAPDCATAQPCTDRFAAAQASISELPAPAAPAAAKPAPARSAPSRPAGAKPSPEDAEREYMKRLNQDLDKLLGQ